MIRVLILALLSWSPLAFAADDFRCMVHVVEDGGELDLTFRGEFQEKGLPKMKMELLAENGFYGEFDPVLTRYDLVEYQTLEIDGEIVGDETITYEFRTQYDSSKGNYQGTLTATNGPETQTWPAKCLYLRGI